MNDDGLDKALAPPSSSVPLTERDRSKESAKSEDSSNYEGVYYGSDDDIDADNDVKALLEEIGEPDENEEPYDILADNGEFLYSEKDQRQYMPIGTTSPSTAAMDLMLSTGEGVTSSTGMMSISEEDSEDDGETEEQIDEEHVDQKVSATPKRSNRRPANPDDILFKPNSRANAQQQQPRRPSPPTPMYLMPQDYKVQNVGSFDSQTDSGDDRSASSEILTGSMKQLVRNIDVVLDEMNAQGETPNNPNDDDTIASEMTVGGTTQLSGELERAQKVFWEFSGIDATGFQKAKKSKKKKRPVASRPREEKKSKTSTIVVLLFSYVVFIGALVAIFVVLRKNINQAEISAISSADTPSTLVPTISPVSEDNTIDNVIANTNMPIVDSSTEPPSFHPSFRPSKQFRTPVLELDETPDPTAQLLIPFMPTAKPTISVEPSLRPSQQFWIPVPGVPTNKGRKKTFNPTAKPIQRTSTQNPDSRQPPIPSTGRDTPAVIAVGNSFPVPDRGGSKPWDDDDLLEGLDDFYSNDDDYEYELHHPNRVTVKEGKHHGQQQQAPKIAKFAKHRKLDSFPWPQQEFSPGIRGRQQPPRSHYYL